MTGFFQSIFGMFLSAGGLVALAALDSSMVFFLPLAVDMAVVYLAAGDPDRFWLYPLLASAGSVAGAGVTFWIGRKIGEQGLGRFVPSRRLARITDRARNRGAVAMALPAIVPPPFPFTPFILTSGALGFGAAPFLVTLGGMRLLRFGLEAGLSLRYGERIVDWMESEPFQRIVVGFVVVAVGGTALSIYRLVHTSRR